MLIKPIYIIFFFIGKEILAGAKQVIIKLHSFHVHDSLLLTSQ
jgi:hypothetical protein